MQNQSKSTPGYIVTTLTLFLIAALVGSILILMADVYHRPLTASGLGTSAIAGSVGLIASLVMLAMIWKRHYLTPRIGTPLVVYGLTVFLILAGDSVGVHDEAMLLLPLTLILAGLLLRRTGIIVFAILNTLTAMGAAYAELTGLIVHPLSSTTNFTTLVVEGVVNGLIALLLFLLVNHLTISLEDSQVQQFKLLEINRILEQTQDSLEAQVFERTSKAEYALQEAEEARHALEIQLWQIGGLAQLGAALTGDQDLDGLANNIVGFLCRYLDLPIGTLYVRQETHLVYTGGVAVAPSVERAVLPLTDGVLGQAAGEKRTIILDNLPDQTLSLISGLGYTNPSSVLILPLIYNHSVVGVIELGALSQFTPRQVQFLERASENIANVLQSALARSRVDDLLATTQSQAEELLAREEELRALNEELQAQSEHIQT